MSSPRIEPDPDRYPPLDIAAHRSPRVPAAVRRRGRRYRLPDPRIGAHLFGQPLEFGRLRRRRGVVEAAVCGRRASQEAAQDGREQPLRQNLQRTEPARDRRRRQGGQALPHEADHAADDVRIAGRRDRRHPSANLDQENVSRRKSESWWVTLRSVPSAA